MGIFHHWGSDSPLIATVDGTWKEFALLNKRKCAHLEVIAWDNFVNPACQSGGSPGYT